jgi:hypothetical protein
MGVRLGETRKRRPLPPRWPTYLLEVRRRARVAERRASHRRKLVDWQARGWLR